ncbi:predicted protein [Chaetoceros tenuissimus]|uniref:EGF-like domain-containing protein n=1 Tax=Chaetoceros tenuissimus TaxID=426638 RepID=A0AAD3H2N9_9STRA|nr:predicted protein [Chaetoceros tenuissimus]
MKLKVVLLILALLGQNVGCLSSKHIGDLDHVSEEIHSEGCEIYFANGVTKEDNNRFLATTSFTTSVDFNGSPRTLTFTFTGVPLSSRKVSVVFTYDGDMNARKERIQILRKNKDDNFTKVMKIGKGTPCDQNQQCCQVSGERNWSADKFNREIRVNGEVVFVMKLTNRVDNGCDTNQGRITTVIVATESQATAEGDTLEECTQNLQDVKTAGAATLLCDEIICEKFEVSSTETPCAPVPNRRQLQTASSRLLQQDSYEGTVTTTTTVTTPENTLNENTLQQNVGQAVSIALANIPAPAPTTPVAPPVYVEPPSPCEGVNCNNAGKCEVTSHTTALCTCENTFVVSESGLGCKCPPGHEFNAGVNRCFPPPTAAPTNSPTKSPTSAPTATPTASPTAEVVPIKVCEDNVNATFPLLFVENQGNCEWLSKNNAEERKETYCGLNHAKLVCPQTCDFCTCEDSSSYTFDLMFVDDPDKKTQDCTWLTRNWNNKEDHIARYCTDDFDDGAVMNACTKSCGLCVNK